MKTENFVLRHYGRYKPNIIAIAALSLVSTLCSLFIPSLMKNIVDKGVANGDFGKILSSCVAMLALAAVSLCSAILSAKLAARLSSAVSTDIRNDMFRKVNSLTFEEFASIGTSSLLTRATEDVFVLQDAGAYFASSVCVPLLLIGGIAASFFADVALALVLVCVLPVVCFIIFLLVRKMGKLWEKSDKYCDAQNKIVRERLYGIRVIRAFDKEDYEHARITCATDNMAHNLVKSNLLSGLITPICSCLLSLATVALVCVGYYRATVTSVIGAGDVIAVVQYVALISNALLTTFWVLAFIPHVKVCGRRVNEVLALKGYAPVKTPPVIRSGDLKLENVTFRYPDGKLDSLENVTAVFPQGKTIGVIGGTGSGKSTLIKLLLKFYPVTRGEITLGGESYENLSGEDVRASVSCAMQKSMIFEGTLRDNVKIANETATDAEVAAAINDACLKEFVDGLDDGLDYALSQSGANLSGGQKQRVNIARAILKKASVYIFDDSFSALDLLTEKTVRARLDERLKGKTRIIVTQRVSSARRCDLIYVFDNGRIVGEGDHAHLMSDCPTYREIYRSQTGEDDDETA